MPFNPVGHHAHWSYRHTMTTLTKHKSRISSDTEEGLLDLSAVNAGLITIERDGSFKDTPSSLPSSPP